MYISLHDIYLFIKYFPHLKVLEELQVYDDEFGFIYKLNQINYIHLSDEHGIDFIHTFTSRKVVFVKDDFGNARKITYYWRKNSRVPANHKPFAAESHFGKTC